MALTSTIASRAAEAAGDWFLRSGIQEESGGVARYYRADVGANARISTEITGYAVSTLVYLHRRTGAARYLEAAVDAATFLTETAWDSRTGVWPFEYPPELTTPAYFFDTGIIVRGLLTLWRATGEEAWLEAALRGGESLRHFTAGDTFHPILRIPSLDPLPYTVRWSTSPGCYQLKSAMAWHDLSVATGREDFEAQFHDAVRTAIRQSDSFLPAETPAKTMDRLHAYLYFLEALLAASSCADLNVQPVLAAGIIRVSRYLRQLRDEFVRSDVYAQLLRVRLIAHQGGIVELDTAEAEEEAAALPPFQVESAENRLNGGYSFGMRDGVLVPHSNPVSTGFCMQALEMWSDFRSGLPLDLSGLI